jgi:hypothetical protein
LAAFCYQIRTMFTDPYAHLGSSWTLWPAHDDRTGQLQIVSGTRQISSGILTVLLTRKGEDYIHPDKGLAPDLFENLNNVAPQYWAYAARQEIKRWVRGIESIYVETKVDHGTGQLRAYIRFVPTRYATEDLLTFGYYEYAGARYNNGMLAFVSDLTLNGQPFFGLA